jgi:hypothetical protein
MAIPRERAGSACSQHPVVFVEKHMTFIDQDAARIAHQEVSTGRLINGAHS